MPGSVDFTDELIPLTLLYTNVYQNVSNQVLEIDKSLVPPGHLWSRLFATRYLTGEDYTDRGYITQKLIDLGYIAKSVYSPVIPPAYLFLQSYESETWFQIDAIEVDPENSDPATQEEAAFSATVVATPPNGSVINFNVEIPAGTWFILGLDTISAVGMQLDTVDNPGDVSSLYVKRHIQQFPALAVPIAFPNTVDLIFDDQDNNQYVLQISDSGELFWTLYGNRTPATLFAPEGLFWKAVEPVLNESPAPGALVASVLNPPDLAQASYTGGYQGGGSGHPSSGTLSFQWRPEDVADCSAGTFAIQSTSGSGLWSTSGTLTVAGIREEPGWGAG
jgi:hypothetical protein